MGIQRSNMKECIECKRLLFLEFFVRKRERFGSICKECYNAQRREIAKNKPKPIRVLY